MDVVECRRIAAALFLLSLGGHLLLSAGECWCAERQDTRLPIILPGDAPTQSKSVVEPYLGNGPQVPFLRPSLAGDIVVEQLDPIPSNSRHWNVGDTSAIESAFEAALVMPTDYEVAEWNKNVPCACEPKRLQLNSNECWTDKELAETQQEFRDLVQCGLLEEANRVLKRMESSGQPTETLVEYDLDLHEARYGQRPEEKPRHHVVGYLDERSDEVHLYRYRQIYQSRTEPQEWDTVAASNLSFHFQGASLGEVASFFHHATGVTVRLEAIPSEALVADGGIYIRCRNKSVEQCLRVVLGSRGLGYLYVNGELMIAAPAAIKQELHKHKQQVDAVWLP